jgi:DNA repair photolyase
MNLFVADSPQEPRQHKEASPRPGAPDFKGSLIYPPKGKAGEYAELACNVYRGCDHLCSYCYVPDVLQMTQAQFRIPALRMPTGDFIRKIERESEKLVNSNSSHRQVLLCFTCDPYQTLDVSEKVTRQVLQVFRKWGVRFITLSKGGSRALRDLDLFTEMDAYAASLTLLDESKSAKWEAGAATPQDRIDTLKTFYQAGIPTWVSLEPVIDPEATLEIIRRTHEFVDLFKVGKLNHVPNYEKTIDWNKFGHDAVDLLTSLGKDMYIKKDLQALL